MKKKKKKFIFWGIIMLFFCVIFIQQQLAFNRLNKEYQGYANQNKQLVNDNAVLNEKLKVVQSDDYIEKMAMEKLGLVKPGETVFKDVNKKR